MAGKVHIGVLLDQEAPYTLEQLSELCDLEPEWIIELVEHGVLEPGGQQPAQWRFSAHALVRTRSARRLRRDFELDAGAVSLVLELLDELRTLRRRVRALETRVGDTGQ